MSWGIAETASELEKLKSESADYLNGLNSCGEIDYSTYSHAFDFYAELIEKAYKFGKDTNVTSNDTVSKSEVCEILADIYPTDGEKVVAVKEIDKAYEAIQQLSSVQPERKECEEREQGQCPWYSG